MISFQDDHSHFVTGSVKIRDPTGENAITLLEKAVRRFGVPEQVLTDQGNQFKPARGELSWFTCQCAELGIHHITASKRRPTTIGKIEAFHKAPRQSRTCSTDTGASYVTTTTRCLMTG